MGFMSCMGNCCACGRLFSFNPERVPSIRGKYVDGKFVGDATGEREPVCEPCITRANEIRAERGLPEFVIPENAYGAEEVA